MTLHAQRDLSIQMRTVNAATSTCHWLTSQTMPQQLSIELILLLKFGKQPFLSRNLSFVPLSILYRLRLNRQPTPLLNSSYCITNNIERRRDAARVTAFTFLTLPLIQRSASASQPPQIGMGSVYYNIKEYIISLSMQKEEDTRYYRNSRRSIPEEADIKEFLLAMDLVTW